MVTRLAGVTIAPRRRRAARRAGACRSRARLGASRLRPRGRDRSPSVTFARTQRPSARSRAASLHDAVDLGRLAVGATDGVAGVVVDPVDEHLDLGAGDERVARRLRDRLLHLVALAQPLVHEVGVDGGVQRRGRRAVLRREREEARPVERGVGEELEQRVVLAPRSRRGTRR